MKKHLIYIFILIPIFVLSNNVVHAPSAEVASLEKYIDMPVGTFTGIPDINIPIYEINANGIKVPINLSYHATAFNPNEHPGWVGMNWSLNAGGCISRSVKGVPDDWVIWEYYRTDKNIFRCMYFDSMYHEYFGSDKTYFHGYEGELADKENDVFYFNFLGYSGKFVFDINANKPVILNNVNNLKIVVDKELHLDEFLHLNELNTTMPAKVLSISGFEIVDSRGFRYHFGGIEADKLTNVSRSTSIGAGLPYEERRIQTDSWHIDKIIDPYGNVLVTFDYECGNWEDFCKPSSGYDKKQMAYFSNFSHSNALEDTEGDNAQITHMGSINVIYPCYLNKINFPSGSIEFQSSKSIQLKHNLFTMMLGMQLNPNDYLSDPTYDKICNYLAPQIDVKNTLNNEYDFTLVEWRKLDKILIKNKQSTLKTFDFNYTENKYERLRLLKLQEKDKPPYLMDYNDLTNRFLLGETSDRVYEKNIVDYGDNRIDQWGYYNGVVKSINQYWEPAYHISKQKSMKPDFNLYLSNSNANYNNAYYVYSFYQKVWNLISAPAPMQSTSELEDDAIRLGYSNYPASFKNCVLNGRLVDEYGHNVPVSIDLLDRLYDFCSAKGVTIYDYEIEGKLSMTDGERDDFYSFRDWVEDLVKNYSDHYQGRWDSANNQRLVSFEAGNKNYCLKRLYLPTGGYNEYIFEPHDVDWVVNRDNNGEMLMEKVTPFVEEIKSEYNKAKVGGLRIKQLNVYSGDSLQLSKRYLYDMGVLNGFPRLLINTTCGETYMSKEVSDYSYTFGITNFIYFSTNSLIPLSSNGTSQHIAYSKVEELIQNNTVDGFNGKVVNYYQNFKNHSDLYSESELSNKKDENLDVCEEYSIKTCILSPYVVPDLSFEHERGKIINKKIFSDKNILVSEEDYKYEYFETTEVFLAKQGKYKYYTYADHNDGNNNYLDKYKFPVYIMHYTNFPLQIPVATHRLTQKTNKLYFDNETVETVEEMSYTTLENYSLLDRTNTYSSKGDEYSTDYYYFFRSSSDNNVYKTMLNKHMISEPTLVLSKTNHKLTDASYKTYTLNNSGNVFLNKTYRLKSLNIPNIYEGFYPSINSLDSTNWEEILRIDKYDNRGNILQYRDNHNIPYSCVWDNSGSNLLAQIKNYEYDNIGNNVLKDIKLLGNYTSNLSLTHIDGLKTLNENIRNFLPATSFITTYTHYPLVGITSQTDPNNTSNFYSYDGSNRLKYVKNNDGNIINQYTYNYDFSPIAYTEDNETVNGNISVQRSDFEFGASGSIGRIIYTADMQPKVTVSDNWITIDRISHNLVCFTVASSSTNRQGTIVLSIGGVSETITIIQTVE